MKKIIKELAVLKSNIIAVGFKDEQAKHLRELRREIKEPTNETNRAILEVSMSISLSYLLANNKLRALLTKDIVEELPVSTKLLGTCFKELNSFYKKEKIENEWVDSDTRLGDHLKQQLLTAMLKLEEIGYDMSDITSATNSVLKEFALVLREEEQERQDRQFNLEKDIF